MELQEETRLASGQNVKVKKFIKKADSSEMSGDKDDNHQQG